MASRQQLSFLHKNTEFHMAVRSGSVPARRINEIGVASDMSQMRDLLAIAKFLLLIVT